MTHKLHYFNLILAVASILFLFSCKKSNTLAPETKTPDSSTPGSTIPATTPKDLYILGVTKNAAGTYTGSFLWTPKEVTSYPILSPIPTSEILYGAVASNSDVYLGTKIDYYKNGVSTTPFTAFDNSNNPFHNIIESTFSIYNDLPIFAIRIGQGGGAVSYDHSIVDGGKRIPVISDDATNKHGILHLIKTSASEYYALINHLIGFSQSNSFILKITGSGPPTKIDLGTVPGKTIAASDIAVVNGKIYVIVNLIDPVTFSSSLSLLTLNTDGTGLTSKAIGTSGAYYTNANAITVLGSEIYICGGEQLTTISKLEACYWNQDNVQVKLPVSATASTSTCSHVLKNGNDLYVIGEEYYGSDPNPVRVIIWKNGAKTVDGLKTASGVYMNALYAYIK